MDNPKTCFLWAIYLIGGGLLLSGLVSNGLVAALKGPPCLVSLAVASCPVVVGCVVAVYGGWHYSVGERRDFKG